MRAIQLVLCLLLPAAAWAQGVPAPLPAPVPLADQVAESPLRLILHDERLIFSSPAHLKARDARWLAPLTAGLVFLAATDSRNMQERIHSDAPVRHRSAEVSDAGLAGLAAIPALLYWRGWREADDYGQTTGVLAARALIDTLGTGEAIRLVTRRARPTQGDGSGSFFHGDALSSSFPSLHAGAAWALASVVAGRYPGWLTQVGAYGLASAVSLSRITGRDHFPSDVLVGSALGFLVGRFVTRQEEASPHFRLPQWMAGPAPFKRNAAMTTGSAYVPLDSWVYAALDRLAAVGLIPSQIAGLRPWTRAECRRQLQEADDHERSGPAGTSVLLSALHRELDSEGAAGVVLDSVYVRSGVIAGPVLNDSYHLGQTWNNDFGRPFGRGWNSDAGLTAHAQSGRFFGEIQAEYQRAPGSDPYPPGVSQVLAALDSVPVENSAQPSTSRIRTIEAYAGMNIGDLQISVGKQALWWGPGYDSPLSFGNNAEPTKNLKISTQHPFQLPGFLRHLGEIRGEFAIGKLGGQRYTWRPWFNAQKLSFKLTSNLELGFTRWSIFWGVGYPMTVGSLVRNLTSTNSPTVAAGRSDPGDRKAGFDFRYRLPGLRNWLTLYSDSYSDDDPSPLAAPRRAAVAPGLYLTHVPGIPKLDFRVEAPSTTPLDGGWDRGGQFIYYNNQYRSGNTNYGDLLGNSVGRDGRAVEGWTSYWFSARNRLEFGYRQLKGSTEFLPGGMTQSDATVKLSWTLADGCFASAMFQYERFWVPLLGGPRRNLSGWVQFEWDPKWRVF